MTFQGMDAASQTLALSSWVYGAVPANTLSPWLALGPNQAILFEHLRVGIRADDNSGHLVLAQLTIGLGDIATIAPQSPAGFSLPYTFPPVANFPTVTVTCSSPPLLVAPRQLINGPSITYTLQNNDAAAAHTFRRIIACTYRIIDNVDFSTGPSLPGAGVGL
jgi:hypothetical protein